MGGILKCHFVRRPFYKIEGGFFLVLRRLRNVVDPGLVLDDPQKLKSSHLVVSNGSRHSYHRIAGRRHPLLGHQSFSRRVVYLPTARNERERFYSRLLLGLNECPESTNCN